MADPAPAAPELSVVLPAFNECAGIAAAVAAYRESFARQGFEAWELLLVDDGSRDGTAEAIDGLAQLDPRIRALHHVQNQGQVPALLTGFAAAIGETVTHNGVDLPFSPDDTAAARERLARGLDLLVVERQDRSSYGVARKVVSWGNSLAWRTLFRSPFRDHNFVQFFRRRALPEIWPQSRGVNTATAEMILRAVRLGRRVEAMPAFYHQRQTGRSSVRFRSVVRAVRAVGGLWWRTRGGRW